MFDLRRPPFTVEEPTTYLPEMSITIVLRPASE
jgi:hypothetical protein